MRHSMSEPVSGSDRVKRAPDSTKVHQPFVSDLYSWRGLAKTMLECHHRLTRSLPLLGSDVESYVAEPFDSYR